jgi:hypothetical protein
VLLSSAFLKSLAVSEIAVAIHQAYQIVNATTALNYQLSLNVTSFGGSIIATFKGA